MLLVVDGRAGLRAGDAELAKTLRGGEVPVAGRRQQSRPPRRLRRRPPSSTRSGSASRSPVSATHGLGTGDLLDAIVDALGDRRRGARTTTRSASP